LASLRHVEASILKLGLADGGQSGNNNELENEVSEGAENDEVVEAELPLGHFSGPPVWDPVGHPEEVTNESESEEDQELDLLILYKKETVTKMGHLACGFQKHSNLRRPYRT